MKRFALLFTLAFLLANTPALSDSGNAEIDNARLRIINVHNANEKMVSIELSILPEPNNRWKVWVIAEAPYSQLSVKEGIVIDDKKAEGVFAAFRQNDWSSGSDEALYDWRELPRWKYIFVAKWESYSRHISPFPLEDDAIMISRFLELEEVKVAAASVLLSLREKDVPEKVIRPAIWAELFSLDANSAKSKHQRNGTPPQEPRQ